MIEFIGPKQYRVSYKGQTVELPDYELCVIRLYAAAEEAANG